MTWDFQQCDTSNQRGSDQPAQSDQSLWQLFEYSHELPKLKMRLHRLIWVYSCQNATLLEITCCGSYIDVSKLIRMWGGNEWMTQYKIYMCCLRPSLAGRYEVFSSLTGVTELCPWERHIYPSTQEDNVVCATNKVSDQPANTGSLIRAFASPFKILWVLSYLEVFSLKGGRTGTSESTLVKMPHYWKSHVTVHI